MELQPIALDGPVSGCCEGTASNGAKNRNYINLCDEPVGVCCESGEMRLQLQLTLPAAIPMAKREPGIFPNPGELQVQNCLPVFQKKSWFICKDKSGARPSPGENTGPPSSLTDGAADRRLGG